MTHQNPLSVCGMGKMLFRSIALTSAYLINGLVQLVIVLSVVWQACGGPNHAWDFKGNLITASDIILF